MSLPKELRGNLLTNPVLRDVMELPYFYLSRTNVYNVVSYCQYCRAEVVMEQQVFKKSRNVNLREAFFEVQQAHKKQLKVNKFLKAKHLERAYEYGLAEAISCIPPEVLVNTGLAIACSIEPQDDLELKRLIALLVDLRDPNIVGEDFCMDKLHYLSPVTTTILSYIGHVEYTTDMLRIMFPKWFDMYGIEVIEDWIRELNPIRLKK